MPYPVFTMTGDIERRYFATAVDVADYSAPGIIVPQFLVVGYKITTSALETNPDVETGTDINGRNFSSVNKLEPTQTFEPHRLTGGMAVSKLGEKLLDMFRFRRLADFSRFRCLHIWGMIKSGTDPDFVYAADEFDACTISINSIGGESWTDMPFQVTFGGNVSHGHADGLIDEVAFTQAANP